MKMTAETKKARLPVAKSALREWVECIVVAFLMAMVIRAFIVQAFKIPTGSMRMTLIEGDIIMVNKFVYGAKIPFTDLRLPAFSKPQRGDVVVFVYPEDPKKDFIKRLVAGPGEIVEIKNGTVYVNEKPLMEFGFSQRYYYNKGPYGGEGNKIVVPPGEYFVLGDNSASSQDSRYWGFVPHKNMLGKAMVIYWPPQRIRMIK